MSRSGSSSDIDAFMQMKGCDDVTVSGETHDLHYGLIAAAGSVLGALLGSDQYPQAFEVTRLAWGGGMLRDDARQAESERQWAEEDRQKQDKWRVEHNKVIKPHRIIEKSKPYYTFTIEKDMDTASPDLYLAWCYRNQRINEDLGLFKKVRIIIRKASGIGMAVPVPGMDATAAANLAHTFMALRFEKVAVESINWEVSGDTQTRETVTFSFQKMELSYIPQLNVILPGMRSVANIKGWDFPPGKNDTWGSSETALERLVSKVMP